MVVQAALTANSLPIEYLYADSLDQIAEVSVDQSKINGYYNMIGHVAPLFSPALTAGVVNTLPAYTLNIPLPFHYTQRGKYLPASATTYNDLKIVVQLNQYYNVIVAMDQGVGAPLNSRQPVAADFAGGIVPSLSFTEIWCNYALVTPSERNSMGCSPRDIVITQTQSIPTLSFAPTNTNFVPYDINFSHSIFALFWTVSYRGTNVNAGVATTTGYQAYANNTDSPLVLAYAPQGLSVTFSPTAANPLFATSLWYENSERQTMGIDYYTLVEPFYHAVRISELTGYNMYSYAEDLDCEDPCGSTNYGKLNRVTLRVQPTTASVANQAVANYVLTVIGRNWTRIRFQGGIVGFPTY